MGGRESKNQRTVMMDDPAGQISQKLRDYYDSVKAEPIPDRFLDLLEQMDKAEAAAGKTGNRSGGDE